MINQLHQKPRSESSLSDEWETPKELFNELCTKYNVNPSLDICATQFNTKCHQWFSLLENFDNALEINWDYNRDVWCNPPHSKNEEFVRKAYDEYRNTGHYNIVMILPTNTMSSKYWHECIEGIAEYHPIKGRIRFLVNKQPSKHMSRNAYVCVIWRKRV